MSLGGRVHFGVGCDQAHGGCPLQQHPLVDQLAQQAESARHFLAGIRSRFWLLSVGQLGPSIAVQVGVRDPLAVDLGREIFPARLLAGDARKQADEREWRNARIAQPARKGLEQRQRRHN